MMFPEWQAGTNARMTAAGAGFYGWSLPDGREGARLVTSWSTAEADVDGFLAALGSLG
jgi:threonine aldolase